MGFCLIGCIYVIYGIVYMGLDGLCLIVKLRSQTVWKRKSRAPRQGKKSKEKAKAKAKSKAQT